MSPVRGMKKMSIRVNDYLLEEPREGPRRIEKTIIKANAYLLEEPPEGPRRDGKK